MTPTFYFRQVVKEIRGKSEMKSEPNGHIKHLGKPQVSCPQKDGIVRVPGIGIEYVAHLDEETYWMLKEYQEKIGTGTFNGAIRRLLNEENQRDG